MIASTRRKPFALPAIRLTVAFLLLPAAGFALDYEDDVMPIFAEKCFDCHSAEADKVKGGLRLDDPEHFLRRFEKNSVVVPGDWDASYLFVTITRPHDSEEAMPPEGKGTPLTEAEILTVANWIQEGAPVGRERGERGPDELEPDKLLQFRDGRLVIEGYTDTPAPVASESPAMTETQTPAPATDEVHSWTSDQGSTIEARFGGISEGQVILHLGDGRTIRVPIDRLSAESQALAKSLATAQGESAPPSR